MSKTNYDVFMRSSPEQLAWLLASIKITTTEEAAKLVVPEFTVTAEQREGCVREYLEFLNAEVGKLK